MWIMILTAIWLISLSILDIRKRSVSAWMLAAGGAAAVVYAAYQQYMFLDMVKGILPGIMLLLAAAMTKKAGYGDGLVLLILGILAGNGSIWMLFAVSLFLGAIFSLVLIAFRKAGRNTRIPFIPFLTGGWLIVMIL